MPSRDFPQVRLHIVTGKGGTGKSTVAAARALALASRGKNVLLCEVEGRQGIAGPKGFGLKTIWLHRTTAHSRIMGAMSGASITDLRELVHLLCHEA